MELEGQEDAVNVGQCISTISAVGDHSKDETLPDRRSVSECSSDNLSDNVENFCEIKMPVTLPTKECNASESDGEIDRECLEINLNENLTCTSLTESTENHTGTLSERNLPGSKTEAVISFSSLKRKPAPGFQINSVEDKSCNQEHEEIASPNYENTSSQSSSSKHSVNILPLNPSSFYEIVNNELGCSVSNHNVEKIETSFRPVDVLVSNNFDEYSYKQDDGNISDSDKPVDENGKGDVNLKTDGENMIEGVFKESSRGNSLVQSNNEERACSCDGVKVFDGFLLRKDTLESDIALCSNMSEGEKCESATDKYFDSHRNENPQHLDISVHDDFDVKENKLHGVGQINTVTAEDGTLASASSANECGISHISNEDTHSSAGVSNKGTTVMPSASCRGPLNYRDSSDSSSESELTSGSDNESVTEITDGDGIIRNHGRRPEPVCHGEFLLTDLPPIEDLNISVPEEECIKIGEISSIVGELAVVQALPNTPALDLDSVLFLDNGKVTLGKIFDVLGPVKEPFYTVRFNSEHHARERGVTVGADVFCAPRTDHTAYIFLAEMMKMKGSDASWEHNNEPPPLCVDYSDDEQERLARRAVVHQRYGEDRDGGPPRKKRGTRPRVGNSSQLNNGNSRGNIVDDGRPDVSPVRGYFSQSLSHTTSYSPILSPRPVFPSVAQRAPGGYSGRYNSPHLMFGGPNFRPPMRTGYNIPLFDTPLRNFAPSVSPGLPPNIPPPMNSPPPYFIRPFHMLPSVPLVHLPPLPPYLSSPHVRPLLCPPRFRPPMDEKRGNGNF